MSPFGKQLRERIQSLYAPQTQIKASSYGVNAEPAAGAQRTIQSEAPATPAPAAPSSSYTADEPTPTPAPVKDPNKPQINPGPGPINEAVTDVANVPPVTPSPLENVQLPTPPTPSTVITSPLAPSPTPAPVPSQYGLPEVAYQDQYAQQAGRLPSYKLDMMFGEGNWYYDNKGNVVRL